MDKNALDIEKTLLSITQRFLVELKSEALVRDVTITTDLERELGMDSIKKADLFHRVEVDFGVSLPDALLSEASSLQDLVVPIQEAGPTKRPLERSVKDLQEKASFNPLACDSFVAVLKGYADNDPDRVHIFLQDEKGQEQAITYGQLLSRSLEAAASLQAYGIKPYETVAIMLPTSEEFFYSFFGILLVGAIPVPIYPPFRPDQIEDYVSRSILILRSAGIRLLITFQEAATLSKQLKPFVPSLITTLTLSQLLQRKDHPFAPVDISNDNPALIQYTSGSTGNPKGVLLHHSNLLNNLRAAITALKVTSQDVVVSWLPLYHDMGLIGKWLGSLYFGVPTCIMPPQSFLLRPERWLWNIHYHRGTISAAPNFAYGYCTKKIDDKLIEGLDLSSWRIAANGAEAVDGKIFRDFYKRFANYGLRESAPTAVYGLAESTVAVVFSDIDTVQHYDYIDRKSLQEDNIAKKSTKDSKDSLEFADCGRAIPGHEIRVVDEKDNVLAERHVGLLQFRGPSSLQGYYQNILASEEIKHGDWFNTGDLAYLADGNLYITGRKKDIIIKAGRNVNPEEIEEVTSQVPEVRKGCVIAFGVQDPIAGTEQLIIVAEIRQAYSRANEQIREAIRNTVSAQCATPPDKVVLVKPGTVPKTSSGKLRRAQCRLNYLEGNLTGRGPPMWWQLVKIFAKSYFKKCTTGLWRILWGFYTAYVGILLAVVVLPLWLLVSVCPRKIAAKVTQKTFRLLLPVVGMKVIVHGVDNLKGNEKCIFVANHTSYLDSVVLMAYLPSNTAFIAKKELLNVPILATFVKRLDYICVQREQATDAVAASDNALNVLQAGRALMIFPEGGISLTPGLRTFKSGAFHLGASTKCKIYPIGLKGTRQILRNENFLLRPGPIQLTFAEPIIAKDNSWEEITRISNAAREEIAKHCGEQLLNVSYKE